MTPDSRKETFTDRAKKILTDKTNIIGFAIAFFGAFLLFPTFFDMGIHPIESEGYLWKSLDSSWALALNYANIQDLTWGSDFAFTYGPLSYLATRIGWGANKYSFLFFDLFYFLNLFCLFFISFIKAVNKISVVVIISLVVLFTPTYLGGAHALVLFMILIFWIRQNIEKPHLGIYALQISLLVLLFYIKFNTGLISFALFYLSLLYIAIFKKDKIIMVSIAAVVPVVIILLTAGWLNVDLGNYIISGYHLVAGYNDIMYLTEVSLEQLNSFALYFILCGAVFILLKLMKYKVDFFKNGMVAILFGIGIFVLYKQGFVRGDIGHILEFFKYGILLVLCLQDFYTIKMTDYKNIFVVAMVVLSFNVTFHNFGWPFEQRKNDFSKSNYISGFSAFTETSGMHLTPNNNQLPSSVIDKIGKSTVDMYPWNVYMLLENGLNYHPRPVIQSYSVYTRYLEDLNFDFYNSSDAPKFVLYDFESIDYRYPLFDETKVNLVLLKNYSVVETFTHKERTILLLERKEHAKPIKLEMIREYAMMMESPIVPEENIYYEVELYNTLGGKMTSVLSHAPEIKLEIKTMNNKTIEYRTSRELLKTGLFLNSYIGNTEGFKNQLTGAAQDNTTKIIQYLFKPVDYKQFKDKIKITEYKISQ